MQSLHGSFTFVCEGVGDGVGEVDGFGVGVGDGATEGVGLTDGVEVGVGVAAGTTDFDPGHVCDNRIPELVVLVAAKVPL